MVIQMDSMTRTTMWLSLKEVGTFTYNQGIFKVATTTIRTWIIRNMTTATNTTSNIMIHVSKFQDFRGYQYQFSVNWSVTTNQGKSQSEAPDDLCKWWDNLWKPLLRKEFRFIHDRLFRYSSWKVEYSQGLIKQLVALILSRSSSMKCLIVNLIKLRRKSL